jgi:serine/threonine protein kinase/class 3 adenylate cyclase
MTPCPSCGTPFFEDAQFCMKCGTKRPVAKVEAGDPLIGRVLGSYRIVSPLGEGAMGKVYRAEQVKLGRPVCVKTVLPQYADEHTLIKRFELEARAMSSLRHPNIVSVLDFGQTDDGVLYLVMELVEGSDLSDVIDNTAPLAMERTLRLQGQILSALEEAHAAGIVHRDLKPSNVMVTRLRDGTDFAKVMDFGIAKIIDDSTADPKLTGTGMVCGTPGYMAPEQILGEELDARCDVYASGVILYEMLTGKAPFGGNTVQDLVRRHLNEVAPSPSQVTGMPIPPAMDALVHRALQRQREQRFSSALEFKHALETLHRALGGSHPVQVPAAAVVQPQGPGPEPWQTNSQPLVTPLQNTPTGVGAQGMPTTDPGFGGTMQMGSGPIAAVPSAPTPTPIAPATTGTGTLNAAQAPTASSLPSVDLGSLQAALSGSAMLCPQCGHPEAPGRKFCGECGAALPKMAGAPGTGTEIEALKKLMPGSLVNHLVNLDEALAGDKRDVTVIFGDISGFTAMSETMDAEQVRQIMNQCFDGMVDAVKRYDGTVDKFIGDCIMVLFGAPNKHENDEERAVRCAMEMLTHLEKVNKTLAKPLGMRVGINSGEVVAGGVGGQGRMDYTVMGDTVNLAQRLESNARVGTILVSDTVHSRTRRLFQFKAVAPFKVKGKAKAVQAFEVGGIKSTDQVSGKFVGRRSEVADIELSLQNAKDGGRSATLFIGEAGIGKTHLLNEAARRARRAQVMVLPMSCANSSPG